MWDKCWPSVRGSCSRANTKKIYPNLSVHAAVAAIGFAPYVDSHAADLPETNNVSMLEVAQAPSPSNQFNYGLEFSFAYDNWSNDLDTETKGQVFSNTTKVSISRRKITPRVIDFSTVVTTGYAFSRVDRGSEDKATGGMTDTQIATEFSVIQNTRLQWKPSFEVSLPTGKTEMSNLEVSSLPTTGLVSNTYQGKGFDAKASLTALIPMDEGVFQQNVYSIRGGVQYLGPYDPTSYDDTDSVDSGYRALVGGGINAYKLGDGDMTLSGAYARTQEYASKNVDTFDLSVSGKYPSEIAVDSYQVLGSYGLRYNDEGPSKSAVAIRETEYQLGYVNSGQVQLRYRYGPDWTLTGAAFGNIGNTKKPQDATYFANQWSYGAGVTSSWVLMRDPATQNSTIQLQASGKYSIQGAEDSFGNLARFSGYTVLVGLGLAF